MATPTEHGTQTYTLVKRRSDLSLQQLNDHWYNVHGQLLASLPSFWRTFSYYVQNHLLSIPSSLASEPPPWDGFAGTLMRPGADPSTFIPEYLSIIRPDELNFLSLPSCTTLSATPHVIKDGPRTKYKYVSFLRPVDGMAHAEFLKYWREQHARVVEECKPFWSSIRRYVQYHGMPELYRPLNEEGRTENFSGVAEIWFDSVEEIERAFEGKEYLETVRPDELKFIGRPTTRFVVEEKVIEMPKGMVW